MKFPLSWLKSYLTLPESPEVIAEALTLAGIEVDAMKPMQEDVIFEVSLTPNLGHCLSIIGLARELAAIFDRPIKRHLVRFEEQQSDKTSDAVSVKIEAPSACSHYSCRLVRGIRVAPSPRWLKERIEACGLRSINNAVDVANYVMIESGHPLHFFDYEKLPNSTLHIRFSQSGERIKTLDEQERSLPPDTLLICSGQTPVAIAGVMGGLDSSVSASTQTVLIESAAFSETAIRRASKGLGLRTDASLRYERGVDPQEILSALERATELLVQVAGGHVCKGAVGVQTTPFAPRVIPCRPSRVNRLLGTQLSQNEIISLFQRLEMSIHSELEDSLEVVIPSYRFDLKHEIDLVEEAGRLYGFNRIPPRTPRFVSSPIASSPFYLFEERSRQALVELGLQECLTCDLISPKLAEITAEKIQGSDALIHVLHPSSIDQSVLRTSLLPGLLQVVRFNLDRQNNSLALFEVDSIHFKAANAYHEQSAAALLLSGQRSPYHFSSKQQPVDFFDIKGLVENFLLKQGIEDSSFEPSHLQNFHPGRQARILKEGICLGFLGQVHPSHLLELGIEQSVYFAEINLNDLYPLVKKQRQTFQSIPPSQFPGSTRDWTITLPDRLPIAALLRAAQTASSPLLEKIELIDLYKSDKIGKDRKNATFRLTYRALQRTVEFQEVEQEHLRLMEHIQEQLRGSL